MKRKKSDVELSQSQPPLPNQTVADEGEDSDQMLTYQPTHIIKEPYTVSTYVTNGEYNGKIMVKKAPDPK